VICPHCFKTIEDDASFCPHCSTYVGGAEVSVHDEFVFCEGCGARLSAHDRTCPKCGRPAPGILSTKSSSSDLAAGKTASFPRLTQSMIESEMPSPRPSAPTAAQVLSDSMDPSATNVLRASDIEAAAASPSSDVDPYHKPKKRYVKPLVCSALAIALVGGGAYFVMEDPLGVMPGFYQAFEEAARDMYPSRQLPQGSSPASSESQASTQPVEMTDERVFQILSSSYNKIVSAYDSLGTIIDDYEYGFIANDKSVRQDKSSSAYAARDALDQVVDEIGQLDLDEDSVYYEDAQRLIQLAGWARTRVDVYCASWDISLAVPEGEKPSAHQSDILAPLRDRTQEDSEARDSYYANVVQWKPVEKDGASAE
jgi:hypothetical protein